LTIPLHEDFYDFAKAYCEQYKEYILNKIKWLLYLMASSGTRQPY
jgi:hypothetical protein